MRLTCLRDRLDCLPITAVPLNLNCRDEIIPIQWALQHVVWTRAVAAAIASHWSAKDVNQVQQQQLGRRGLNYWEVIVLAAMRLGCNLDYDKLQDLAENHRSLRQIMGIGDWQDDQVDFDWRRIEDNQIKLQPETLKKINALIVGSGSITGRTAVGQQYSRGDTFVVETNIHYPTDSSLIGDGLREKSCRLAAGAESGGERRVRLALAA